MSQWSVRAQIVTGLVSATAIVAALASMTGSQRASVAGLTVHGQIATAQDAGLSGDAGLVALATVAPGTTGQVLTMGDGGLPVWRSAAGGGSSITSGTYAARPASPAAGDIYTVTSGARRGSVYRAPAASTWELWRVLSPVSGTTVFLDGERFENAATGAWAFVWPNELGAPGITVNLASASITVLASAAGGLPGVTFAGTVGMRVPWMGPSGAASRWLAMVVSRCSATSDTYEHLGGWGEASAGKLFALTIRTGGVTRMGAHWWSSNLASSTAPVSGTTPSVYLLQYDGTTATLYADAVSIASGSVVLNTGTAVPLILGVNPGALSEAADCTMHAVLAGAGTLDSTARTALQTWAQDRFGAP